MKKVCRDCGKPFESVYDVGACEIHVCDDCTAKWYRENVITRPIAKTPFGTIVESYCKPGSNHSYRHPKYRKRKVGR